MWGCIGLSQTSRATIPCYVIAWWMAIDQTKELSATDFQLARHNKLSVPDEWLNKQTNCPNSDHLLTCLCTKSIHSNKAIHLYTIRAECLWGSIIVYNTIMLRSIDRRWKWLLNVSNNTFHWKPEYNDSTHQQHEFLYI